VAMTPSPVTVACPLGQGFWKNHPDTWPVTSLTLGSQTYTQAELLALFDTPPKGDASLILTHQLIAAKLNIVNGSNPAPIRSAIADADKLLSQFFGKLPYIVGTSSDIGQQMVNDANVLDRYNNGDLTPDCRPSCVPEPHQGDRAHFRRRSRQMRAQPYSEASADPGRGRGRTSGGKRPVEVQVVRDLLHSRSGSGGGRITHQS